MERGVTIPNLPQKANIDKKELKVKLVRSKLEMDNNVDEGTFPIFGYPLVCYSPAN